MAVSKTPSLPDSAPRDVRVDRSNRVASATSVPATVVGTAETPEAVAAPQEQGWLLPMASCRGNPPPCRPRG
ncbi:MAG: hypothetical protein Ct9H300mP1_02320 [Planctomycetaceae bacterium]|nr:MAG: hypothetical protein Ct9H300mP1_02320 [Planctomycetaceae bacterium]